MQKAIIFGLGLWALCGAITLGADDSFWGEGDPWGEKEKEIRLLRERYFLQNPGLYETPDQVPFVYRPLEEARKAREAQL